MACLVCDFCPTKSVRMFDGAKKRPRGRTAVSQSKADGCQEGRRPMVTPVSPKLGKTPGDHRCPQASVTVGREENGRRDPDGG